MIAVETFHGLSVALFGLGGSGLASAEALRAGGAQVVVWDDNPKAVQKAQEAGFHAQDLRVIDWRTIKALILTPGVPLTHPKPHWAAQLAIDHEVEIIGDVELFCRERARLAPHAPFIAITGTNGKSTTTALIAHILRESERNVAMGGNIGTPILALPPPNEGHFHVIELSSYQIDLTPSLAPSLGLLLNLTPDHIDRHGSMAGYASVKERMIAKAEHAIINVDDDDCAAIAKRREEKTGYLTRISRKASLKDGVYIQNRHLFWREKDRSDLRIDLSDAINLRGDHNAQNAAFAFAACSALQLSDDEIQKGMVSFPGLAHRMERVGQKGKVLFINDSKATNADSTEKALLSFVEPIFWIAGGKPKEGGISPLAPLFPRITKAYLIGEASAAFAQSLEGKVPYEICGTLETAVICATRDAQKITQQEAQKEAIVLLSPACASFDQFANFEARGEAFRALILGMGKA